MSAALKPLPPPMTTDEFLRWTLEQPGDTKYELLDGQPTAMAPPTFVHGDVKFAIGRRLAEAVERAGLPCRVMVDSVGVRIGPHEMYIPDVMLHCGSPIDPRSREIDDPLVLVEVASPSTSWLDETQKLIGYFSLPSVRHYLLVQPIARKIVHHARGEDGVIITRFSGGEPIRLDPPGLTLEGMFPAT